MEPVKSLPVVKDLLAGTFGRNQWRADPWRKRRKEWIGKYGGYCRSCRREDVIVHVHHVVYRRDHQLHEAADDELTALCESCHARWHVIFNNLKKGMLGFVRVDDFAVVAAAILIGHKVHGSDFFDAVAELVSSRGTVEYLAKRRREGK